MQRLPLLALILCASLVAIASYRALGVEVHDVEAVGEKPTLIVEFGEGAPVQQLFAFPHDGLSSITIVIWSEHALTLDVEFELRRATPGETNEVLASSVRTLLQPAGQSWHTFELNAVPRAKGHIFAALFRLRSATAASLSRPPPGTFGLMAWADDPLTPARLFVGGRPRWGDLAFIARSEPATRLERMLRALDAQVPKNSDPGRLGWLLLFSGYGVLVLLVAWIAMTTLTRRPRNVEPSTAALLLRSSSVTSVLLLVGTLATGAALLAAREQVAIDLLDNIDTVMESPQTLQRPFGRPEEPIGGLQPQVIFAHPPARLTWRITVPAGKPMLRTAIALRPYVWEGRSDGVTFSIHLEDGTTVETVYSRFINPAQRFEDRAWIPVEVDLSRFVERPVGVTLETTPGPSGNTAFDWAMWAHPRVVAQ